MKTKEAIQGSISTLKHRKEQMIDYLLMKVEIGDWHGVADAAMDIREIDAEIRALHFATATQLPEAP